MLEQVIERPTDTVMAVAKQRTMLNRTATMSTIAVNHRLCVCVRVLCACVCVVCVRVRAYVGSGWVPLISTKLI